MKIAAHVLGYNVTRFLKPVLENLEPHVDKIYIAYAERPFGYNEQSRQTKKNPTKISDIHAAMSSPKIEIVTGDWNTENEMRNACLAKARADGFDWFIIQDADEFYSDNAWRQIKRMLHTNKTDDHFTTTWYNFWKSSHYVIVDQNGSMKGINAGFAIRCNSKILFTDRRQCGVESRIIDYPCFHYSYVLSDTEMSEKISTWSHANMLFSPTWYQVKWQNWTESTRFLDPVFPWTHEKAIRFPGDQPDFAEEFALPVVEAKPDFDALTKDAMYDTKVNWYIRRGAVGRMVRSFKK